MTTTEEIRPGLPLTYDEAGEGPPALVLHGGGGPQTVASLAGHLAKSRHVITPVHPGWNGTPRPGHLASFRDLGGLYLELLRERGLRDVLVAGSSVGGWIAAELASQADDGRLGGLILIDGTGVEVPEEPVRDFYALDARGVARYAWHDAERFYGDPATVPPEQAATQAANMTTMQGYAGGTTMFDPGLRARLAGVTVPALVLWGVSDRIVTPGYGRQLAASLGHGRFEEIAEAGHLPQLEQPAATFAAIDRFLADEPSR